MTKKYTPEEKEAARIRRNAKDAAKLRRLNQKRLLEKLDKGDPNIERCVCGKIHNTKRGFGKAEFCRGCPFWPKLRARTFFAKRTQEYKTYYTKR